ncbi:KTR2 [Symbiodinium sp. CCMP2592]|nr:KTR2 [Symbiodinium sp. CCMP2592]
MAWRGPRVAAFLSTSRPISPKLVAYGWNLMRPGQRLRLTARQPKAGPTCGRLPVNLPAHLTEIGGIWLEPDETGTATSTNRPHTDFNAWSAEQNLHNKFLIWAYCQDREVYYERSQSEAASSHQDNRRRGPRVAAFLSTSRPISPNLVAYGWNLTRPGQRLRLQCPLPELRLTAPFWTHDAAQLMQQSGWWTSTTTSTSSSSVTWPSDHVRDTVNNELCQSNLADVIELIRRLLAHQRRLEHMQRLLRVQWTVNAAMTTPVNAATHEQQIWRTIAKEDFPVTLPPWKRPSQEFPRQRGRAIDVADREYMWPDSMNAKVVTFLLATGLRSRINMHVVVLHVKVVAVNVFRDLGIQLHLMMDILVVVSKVDGIVGVYNLNGQLYDTIKRMFFALLLLLVNVIVIMMVRGKMTLVWVVPCRLRETVPLGITAVGKSDMGHPGEAAKKLCSSASAPPLPPPAAPPSPPKALLPTATASAASLPLSEAQKLPKEGQEPAGSAGRRRAPDVAPEAPKAPESLAKGGRRAAQAPAEDVAPECRKPEGSKGRGKDPDKGGDAAMPRRADSFPEGRKPEGSKGRGKGPEECGDAAVPRRDTFPESRKPEGSKGRGKGPEERGDVAVPRRDVAPECRKPEGSKGRGKDPDKGGDAAMPRRAVAPAETASPGKRKAPGAAAPGVWEFSVKDGFKAFGKESQDVVEALHQAFLAGGDRLGRVPMGKHTILVDFVDMKQRMEGGSRERCVRRRLA